MLVLYYYFLHNKFNGLMKIVDMIEKVIQVCMVKNGIIVTKKLSPDFLGV